VSRGRGLRVAVGALVVVVAALATVSLGAHGWGLLPDLVLPGVVAAGLVVGPSRGLLVGLAAGWVLDLLPPGSGALGTQALLYAAAGLLAGAGRREGRTPVGWVVLVAAACAVLLGLGRAVVAGAGGAVVAWDEAGARLGLSAALAGLAVPLLLWAERALVRRAV
jgi:rod shape-determining protein MreD